MNKEGTKMKFSFQNKWIYAECEIFRYYSPNFRLGGGVPAIRDFISQVVKSCKRGMNPFRSLFQASQEQFSVPPSFLLDGFLSLDGRCALTFAGLRDCAIITWREGWEMGKIRLKIKSHPPPLLGEN